MEGIEADIDRLEREQQDDGGGTFDSLGWSPGQSVESRGVMTLWALATLGAHGRIEVRRGAGDPLVAVSPVWR